MSFMSILKAIGVGAKSIAPVLVPAVASAINPALVPVFAFATQAVLNTEAAMGSARGSDKLTAAMNSLAASTPALVTSIEMSTGSELANEVLFQRGLQKITEGTVDMLNAFKKT